MHYVNCGNIVKETYLCESCQLGLERSYLKSLLPSTHLGVNSKSRISRLTRYLSFETVTHYEGQLKLWYAEGWIHTTLQDCQFDHPS